MKIEVEILSSSFVIPLRAGGGSSSGSSGGSSSSGGMHSTTAVEDMVEESFLIF